MLPLRCPFKSQMWQTSIFSERGEGCGGLWGGGGLEVASHAIKAGGLRNNPFSFPLLPLSALILLSFPLLSNDHRPTSDYPFHNSTSVEFINFWTKNEKSKDYCQNWFRTTCIVSHNNILAGHTSLLQVYRWAARPGRQLFSLRVNLLQTWLCQKGTAHLIDKATTLEPHGINRRDELN